MKLFLLISAVFLSSYSFGQLASTSQSNNLFSSSTNSISDVISMSSPALKSDLLAYNSINTSSESLLSYKIESKQIKRVNVWSRNKDYFVSLIKSSHLYASIFGNNKDIRGAMFQAPTTKSNIIVQVGSVAKPSSITLSKIATYQITFQVNTAESTQPILILDSGNESVEITYTIAGRASLTNNLTGTCLISTTVPDAKLSIRNSRNGGETSMLSANWLIKQLN